MAIRHVAIFPFTVRKLFLAQSFVMGMALLAAGVESAWAQTLHPISRPARIDSLMRADSLERAEKARKGQTGPDTVDVLGGVIENEGGDSLVANQPPGGPGVQGPTGTQDSTKGKAREPEDLNDTLAIADDTVEYQSSRIRYRNDRFSLAEGAWLTYKGSKLEADSIVYFHERDLVEAFGAPLITDKDNPPILGYRMRYNIKRRVGEVYWGSSKKGNQVFNGMEVRRQRSGAIYIARGDFSTCDEKPDQHFYFYGRRMIVEPNSKVLSGPIVMNIADVPVAVLPMLVMPLGSGRRSGFLQPKFGGDQAQGFYMQGLGYYWAISDYHDLLVSGDLVEGEQGTFSNTNADARYTVNLGNPFRGSLGGKTYVRDFDPATTGWMVDFSADGNITPDGRQTVKGSGTFQSDPDVVANNALNDEDRTQQTANANLGYRRQFSWNQATLNVDASQVHNLTDDLVDRNIPNATFTVGGPLFPAAEIDEDEFTDSAAFAEEPFWRKLSWNYSNRFNVNQVKKPRTVAPPGDTSTYAGYSDNLSFSGKYNLMQYVNFTPSLNMNQLWSLTSKTGDSADPVRNAFRPDENEYGDYFFGWNTAANFDTKLYGIAQADSGQAWFGVLQGIRHVVTPGMSLTYAPEIDTNTHFAANPKIGGTPYQNEQRTVGMSLANDVDLKFAQADTSKKAEPYKLVATTSSINYNFANKQREWSDIPTRLSLYVTRNIAFDVNLNHTLYDDYAFGEEAKNEITAPILTSYSFGWRKGLSVGGDFSNGVKAQGVPGFADSKYATSPWTMDLNYSFNFSAARVGTAGGMDWERFFGFSEVYRVTRTHQASGSLKINPTKEWQLSYDTDYNFSEGEFSRHNFTINRKLHCWDMHFRWTPVGLSEGWSFVIRIIDLPDIKLETADLAGRKKVSR